MISIPAVLPSILILSHLICCFAPRLSLSRPSPLSRRRYAWEKVTAGAELERKPVRSHFGRSIKVQPCIQARPIRGVSARGHARMCSALPSPICSQRRGGSVHSSSPRLRFLLVGSLSLSSLPLALMSTNSSSSTPSLPVCPLLLLSSSERGGTKPAFI